MSGQPKLLRLAWQFRRQWLLVRRRLLLYKTKSRIDLDHLHHRPLARPRARPAPLQRESVTNGVRHSRWKARIHHLRGISLAGSRVIECEQMTKRKAIWQDLALAAAGGLMAGNTQVRFSEDVLTGSGRCALQMALNTRASFTWGGLTAMAHSEVARRSHPVTRASFKMGRGMVRASFACQMAECTQVPLSTAKRRATVCCGHLMGL